MNAGTASAVLGFVHYGSGVISAAMLGRFADGTPWTMSWIIGLCGLGALISAIAFGGVKSDGPRR